MARRLHALARGLTSRGVLAKFAAMQMIDVHLPTDGRELVLTRYTEAEPELSLLLNKLKLVDLLMRLGKRTACRRSWRSARNVNKTTTPVLQMMSEPIAGISAITRTRWLAKRRSIWW